MTISNQTAFYQVKIFVFLLALSFVGLVSNADATLLEFEGTLSTPVGIQGQHQWANDFSISWDVEQQANLTTWLYTYTLATTGDTPSPISPSHLSLEISPEAGPNDFSNFSSSPQEFGGLDDTGFGAPGTMPNGLKLDWEASAYSFLSTKAPVWGDFFAKGRRVLSGGPPEPGDFNAAWNTDFGLLNPLPNPSGDPLFPSFLTAEGLLKKDFDPNNPGAWQGEVHYKILRPDSTNGGPEIPEPASALLFAFGLAGTAFLRRR